MFRKAQEGMQVGAQTREERLQQGRNPRLRAAERGDERRRRGKSPRHDIELRVSEYNDNFGAHLLEKIF